MIDTSQDTRTTVRSAPPSARHPAAAIDGSHTTSSMTTLLPAAAIAAAARYIPSRMRSAVGPACGRPVTAPAANGIVHPGQPSSTGSAT